MGNKIIIAHSSLFVVAQRGGGDLDLSLRLTLGNSQLEGALVGGTFISKF